MRILADYCRRYEIDRYIHSPHSNLNNPIRLARIPNRTEINLLPRLHPLCSGTSGVTAIDCSPQAQPWRLVVKSGLLTAANFRRANFRSLGIWPDPRSLTSSVVPVLFRHPLGQTKARRVESAGLGWVSRYLTRSAINQREPRAR